MNWTSCSMSDRSISQLFVQTSRAMRPGGKQTSEASGLRVLGTAVESNKAPVQVAHFVCAPIKHEAAESMSVKAFPHTGERSRAIVVGV
jgi:hypothetical protein